MKYGVALLALIGAIWLGSYFLAGDSRPVSLAQKTNATVLTHASHSIFFQPKGDAIPLTFDRLDLSGRHRIEYFVENGYIGLLGQKDQDLRHLTKFPVLSLNFPSLVMPERSACEPDYLDLDNGCPVSELRLERIGDERLKVYKQLYGDVPFREAERRPERRKIVNGKRYHRVMDDVMVYQWSTFYTDRAGKSQIHDKWLGWECNDTVLDAENSARHSFAKQDNLWISAPVDVTECANESRATQQHPVIWQCQLGDECEAVFDFYGSVMRLTLPQSVMKGQLGSTRQKQRHHMLKTAWLWLQQAAIRAENNATFDVVSALKQELKWCQEVDDYAQSLMKVDDMLADITRKKWQKSGWKVVNYYPRSPCSRAMHRLIQLHDLPTDDMRDAEVLMYAKSLEDIVLHYDSEIDTPLKALLNDFTVKTYGEHSVEAFVEFATHQKIFKSPQEMLAKYDKIGQAFTQLTPEKRVMIRKALGDALNREKQTTRGRELTWLALEDYLANPQTLDNNDAVWLMIYATSMTRNPKIGENEHPPEISTMVAVMADFAKQIHLDTSIKASTKRLHIATLSMHIAYHMYHLGEQDRMTWLPKLEKWYQDVKVMLDVTDEHDMPRDLQATKVHVDALRHETKLSQDCAGAHISGCQYYAPKR